jgi:hypothetical protein
MELGGKNYVEDLHTLFPSAINIRVDQIEKNEKVGACITHEVIKKYIKHFSKYLK